ncbi:MAG: shikimate kinase [Planctomycetota bacterium]|jgi:shikimate kinase
MSVNRVVLIGLRCSGKTTVGRAVAARLGWDFVDADEELVKRAGRTIAEIFATDGEPVFRKLEKETLADLCGRERVVIATGGGAVLDPENVRVMREGALVAHLDAPTDVLWKRMQTDPATGEQRPALTDLDGKAEMEAVARERAALYGAARHLRIDTDELDAEAAARAIVEAL